MIRISACLALCVSAMVWAQVPGRSTPPQTTPQFRAAVDLVHLDVSVLDRNRQPVRGLTAADFTILEDGDPRSVAAFAAVDVPSAPKMAAAAPWVRAVIPDVQINETVRHQDGRLFVLLLDDAMIPRDPAMMATAKKIAETAIDRMSPGDQMAVVFTAGSRGAQNFTSNRAKLLQAVSTFQPGFATHVLGWDTATLNMEKDPPVWERQVDSDDGYRSGSVRTLEDVTTSLAAAPQRRKAILWVSTGVFADSAANSDIVMVQPGQSRQIREANASLVGRLPALYRRMQAANITLYALDPAGLGGMEEFVSRTAASVQALRGATRPMSASDDWLGNSPPPMAMDLAKHIATVNLDFLKAAAANTGGLAITDTNDLTGGITRIFDENGSYYLLGFALPADHRAGSLHRLQVKVNRPDVTVRTRTGYEVPERPVDATPKPAAAETGLGPPKLPPAAKAAPSPATLAVAGPVAAGTLPMRVALAPFAAPTSSDKRAAAVAIALGLEQNVREDSEQTFDIEVRAFTNEGSGKFAERRTGKVTLHPVSAGETSVDVLSRIALPPGRYELRFGAHLSPAGVAGGLFADLEIPDFSKAPLSLSGVLLESTPAGNAGPLDALEGLVSIVPTSRREFTGAERRISTFLRVYQGGDAPLQPVWLRVTIRDAADRAVYNYPYRLTLAKFDAARRSADFTFDLPLQVLKPGEYVLLFDASAGTFTATRQVRFAIR